MRGKVVLAVVVAAACVAAAWVYFSPAAMSSLRQMLPGARQAAATDKPAGSDKASADKAGGKSGAGGNAARSASIVSATATMADFPIRRYAIGFVSSPAVVNINARVSSQIVSIDVRDGQMVKAGDLLFSLDDRALKAQLAKDQATLAKDQALLTSSGSDLQRAKDLVAKQAGTQQTYDQAVAAQKAAAATVDADKATIDADNVQLGFASIKAPIAGRLGAVNVSVGDLVTLSNGNSSTATPLVTITEMDPLQVNFNLPESNLALLHKALANPQQGAVTLTKDGDPTPIGNGTLDFVDSSVDTASGTIATRASIPNADLSLWPGQYVNGARRWHHAADDIHPDRCRAAQPKGTVRLCRQARQHGRDATGAGGADRRRKQRHQRGRQIRREGGGRGPDQAEGRRRHSRRQGGRR